jgi:hypothetical protein
LQKKKFSLIHYNCIDLDIAIWNHMQLFTKYWGQWPYYNYTLDLLVNRLLFYFWKCRVRVLVFNATFNNISVISWRPVLLVEETGVPRENLLNRWLYTIIVFCWGQYKFLWTLKRYSPKPLGWGEYWFLRSIKTCIDRYKRL